MARTRKHKNGHDVEARIKALKSDFDALQSDMRKLVESVGEAAGSGVSDLTNGAAKAATEAAGQVEHWAEDGVDGVRGAIREQPFTAIALSMGAGAIIGTLLRR
jgi:ElaB/YqjD/DUF883 family membrane-anchored ribosome-binding protein